MDARFYNSEDIDIERLASDLVNVYISQGYQAQQIGDNKQQLVQVKKGGDFEAIIGMQAALSITFQRTAGGTLVMIGKKRWIDKAAVGAVGIVAFAVLWPLAFTAGVGALRQASLGNQALNLVDGLVRQQRPGIQMGPIPVHIVPQIQQQWAPAPALPSPVYVPPSQSSPMYIPSQPVVNALPASSNQLRCAHCNTPYEVGDTFCTGCGRAITPPKLYCSNCNSEVKPGVAFCPKCGASNFQAQAAANSSIPNPGPAHTLPSYGAVPSSSPMPTYTPSPVQPTPVYQQPVQQQPMYTPPVQPAPVYTPPPQPTYTPPVTQDPPVQPQPTVYYTPVANQSTVDASAPTISSAPKQPAEQYYTPPVTQNPPVSSQPKVTFVTQAPHQEPPVPQKPQARPQKQYYIPSNAAQSGDSNTAPTQPTTQPTLAAIDLNAVWGSLLFSDGQQIELKGEHAIVGRYDHDLSDLKPEVDLSQMQGSDTISRVHAAFEHLAGSNNLTDLNSTNATRINGKRLEPDNALPINEGDTLQFGKITCVFHKA